MTNDSKKSSSSDRLGRGMIYFAWIIALGFASWMFSHWLVSQHNPNRILKTVSTAGMKEVTLQRNRYGHYLASGKINSSPVEFMLDTGATTVVVPGNVATDLRLKKGVPVSVITANGTVTAYLTRLDKVELGGITLRNVKANISPQMEGGQVLLGMSFLKHLEFTQRGDTLILKQSSQ